MNIFSANLNDKEKEVFVKAIARLIKTDGVLNDDEKKFFKEVVNIYDVDYAKILSEIESEQLCLDQIKQTILSRSKVLFLIKELLTVANIDDNLAEEEVRFIEKVADVLNVEQEKILQINQLVLNRKLWLQEYAKIMEEEV